MTDLITKDLSEPYSIYTYRYFLHTWPQLSFLVWAARFEVSRGRHGGLANSLAVKVVYKLQVLDKDECVGCVVCKLETHRDMYRGYIAMLAVKKEYRGRRLGKGKVAICSVRATAAHVPMPEHSRSIYIYIYISNPRASLFLHRRFPSWLGLAIDLFRLNNQALLLSLTLRAFCMSCRHCPGCCSHPSNAAGLL